MVMVIDPLSVLTLFAMANESWKSTLTSSREKVLGSVEVLVQLTVIVPAETGF